MYPKGLLNRAGKNPGPIAWAKKKYCSWAHENRVWWSGVQVKLTSAVDLLVIISNQKLFQNLRLQDEQNNEMKAWMTMEFQFQGYLHLSSVIVYH